MVCTYERWHDGVGYDIEVLRTATPDERASIESMLISHGIDDWRDVEALASLDSPAARHALQEALKSADHRVRLAVQRFAPALVSDAERASALVAAVEGSDLYGGLTQALDEIESFHPPEVVNALLRGALTGSGEKAVHFAAMLMFLHGRAESPFDWSQRPFFLRFHTDNVGERAAVFRELCAKLGVNLEAAIGREPSATSSS